MAYVTIVQCDKCGKKTEYQWKSGLKYICSYCHIEINFRDACFEGRVTTGEGQLMKLWNKKKKKRGG